MFHISFLPGAGFTLVQGSCLVPSFFSSARFVSGAEFFSAAGFPLVRGSPQVPGSSPVPGSPWCPVLFYLFLVLFWCWVPPGWLLLFPGLAGSLLVPGSVLVPGSALVPGSPLMPRWSPAPGGTRHQEGTRHLGKNLCEECYMCEKVLHMSKKVLHV